ncbi:DNA cytosine methyltransferase [Streptomyces sp. NBC_01454]|uniref:DNA cytosine methyltransferase n=1 Tax=Streptomyces sp. NBC_01454 TaxID=2975867 RepID=UPI002E307415|nr:DNA cytosine methyltransferase [Streptomyces sp. NBC_01454]
MSDYDSVDLFAGPGGLDMGAAAAGLRPVGIEWDANAVATRVAAGLATVHDDVRRYGPADFPDARRLLGGPPCQTFTVAGTGAGRRALDLVVGLLHRMAARDDIAAELAGLDDVRTGLVLEPMRWALEAADAGRPYRTVVLEQVQQVLPVWLAYAEVLRAEGYSVAAGVLRSEQFGVPQTRRRAVLVARLDGVAVLPTPTHRPYRAGVPRDAGDARLLPWVSMGEALDRPGPFTVISNYGTGGDPKNRGRRSSAEPAFTVTGKISRNRIVDMAGRELPRFSHSEAGQLQGFPADYPWSGNDIAQQAGNSVPVQLGAALVGAAVEHATTPALEVAA